MRLYIGTLYTIENEYDDCVQSINQQSYRNFDHFVFQNLPNKEAHARLFRSFLDQADIYDALIKVDADMVLSRTTLFAEIVAELETNPWAQVLSIAVHDFFSDELIWGLNAYRNTVRWDFNKETLFVDRPNLPKENYLTNNSELAPAAYHCKNPSPYQAFHFGVHRGLKVIQHGNTEQNESTSKSHFRTMERTWEHFLRAGDVRLGLASLGAELAYQNKFTAEDLNYSNPKMNQVLERYFSMNRRRLELEIRRLRILNFSFLPSSRRRRLLRFLNH